MYVSILYTVTATHTAHSLGEFSHTSLDTHMADYTSTHTKFVTTFMYMYFEISGILYVIYSHISTFLRVAKHTLHSSDTTLKVIN